MNGSQTHGRPSAVSPAHGRRAVATAQAHVMEVSRGSGVCAALCIRRTLCRHVTIGTPMVIFCCFDCLLTVFDEWYTVPIVKNTQNHWRTNRHRSTKTVPTVYQQCTNRQKHSKDSPNSKKSPLVYQSSHVYTESAEYTKPRKRRYLARLHDTCLGSGHSPSPVGRADCIVSTLHGRPCVWLPFAAACCYTLFYLLMMPAGCSSSSLSTIVIKFSIFSVPLGNFLLSRPNSVEYRNSKTTTLLPSAKCTRPLFQGRTGCGGRPSGWHDIVTCQRLVFACYPTSNFKCKSS